MAKNPIHINKTTGVALATLALVLGLISVLNAFKAIELSFTTSQYIMMFFTIIVMFEIGLRGFKKLDIINTSSAIILVIVIAQFLLAIFALSPPFLTKLSAIATVLLIILGFILAFTKQRE